MTRDEAVAIIQQQLGFRTDLTAVIITNLKLAQVQLEGGPTKPWFLVSERMTKRTTADDSRVAVPESMLQQVDMASVRFLPDDTMTDLKQVTLKKNDYDVLMENYKDVDTGGVLTGSPAAYALQGEYFHIFPTPDDQYLLQITIFQQDTVLNSNIENGWLKWAPFTLIGKAGWLVASATRDKDAQAAFKLIEQEGRLAIAGQDIARDMSDQTPQIGGPH